MPSNHIGDPTTFTGTLSLLVGGDAPSAALWRVPEEKLLDNTVWLKTRRDLARQEKALLLRTQIRAGHTIDDTSDSLGAIYLSSLAGVLVVKANSDGVFRVSEGSDRYALLGTLSDVTGAVKAVASYGGAILVFGVGTNHVDLSSDSGASWIAGANPGISGARCRAVADPDNSRFILSSPSNASVRNSVDGTSWAAQATGCTTGVAGLSQTPFKTIALSEGANTMRVSSDGGTTWGALTGFPANAGTFDESGDVVGDYANSRVWHAARIGGDRIQVDSATVVGSTATWTVRAANLPSTNISGFSARPRILVGQDTGLIVVVCKANGGNLFALFTSIDGDNWTGPTVLAPGSEYSVDGFAVAGGRLFATVDSQLFASDGIGADEFL